MHVDSCLRQAVTFLESVQLPHGEFKTLIGTQDDLSDGVCDSSPFTTTFVTYALQEVDQINVGGMLRKGLNFLQQQREIGGLWRFYSSKNYKHIRTPPDLDDTACASFALQQAGRRSHNEWAFRYLQEDDGRFLTWFLPRQDIRPSLRASLVRVAGEFEARSYQRFTNRPPLATSNRLLTTEFDPVPSNDVDPVVNANAVLYLAECKLTEAAIEYLIRSVPVAQDGEFSLYYRDKLTLLHAVARAYRHSAPSLRALDGVMVAEVGARAASGNLFRSAHSAAMGASVLMTLGADGSTLEEAIDAIMGFQRRDGSFKEETFYSGPAEYWGSPELTTAFCIEALARYGNLAHGRMERRTPVEPEVTWNPEGVLTGPEGVDADWYLVRYPDAVGHESAAAHYANHGWKEGKDPSPKFSTAWYLSDNPDVAAAQINPLLHYLRHGRMEGRTPVEPEVTWNPEGVLTGPEGVDADWYLARYPDAVGHASAAAHYANHGWKEGKDPNPKFSTAWYLSENPDIAASEINPLLHYLRHGRMEGRRSAPPAYSIIRARDWWPSKVTLALAIGFATLLQIEAPVTSSLIELFALSFGVATCAVYVSFINDFSDADQDAAVGKRNIFHGKSLLLAPALISLSLLSGIMIAFMWRDDFISVLIYAASWVSFSLYSLRPLRLKERAHLGVVADACGAHLFPALLATTLVFHSHGLKADLSWLACIGVWSFCLGLRSVIAHQVDDERNDDGADIKSYVRRVGNTRALFISEYLLLPLEIMAFAIMLVHVGSTVVVVIFVGYGLVILANRASHRNQMNWNSLAILSPYYAFLFPLSVLLSSAIAHPLDLIAVVLFLGVFHRTFQDIAKSLYGQTKRAHFPERVTFKL